MTTYSCSRIRTLRHEIARTGSDEARVAASAQEREAASVRVHAPLQSACTRCHTNPKSWVWARQVPGTSRPAAAQSKRRGVVLRSRSGKSPAPPTRRRSPHQALEPQTQRAQPRTPVNNDPLSSTLEDLVPARPSLRNTGRYREPKPRPRRGLETKHSAKVPELIAHQRRG